MLGLLGAHGPPSNTVGVRMESNGYIATLKITQRTRDATT